MRTDASTIPRGGIFQEVTGREPWRSGIRTKLEDGTSVDAEVYFLAVPDGQYDKLGSLEATGFLINEIADYGDQGIISAVMGSMARYPSKDMFSKEYLAQCEKEGKPAYPARLLADFNPPSSDHWLQKLETDPPHTVKFFAQKPPLIESNTESPGSVERLGLHYTPNPQCTFAKIQSKGYTYWTDLLGTAEPYYVESRILGRYSKTVKGKAVFAAYDEPHHLAASRIDYSAFAGQLIIVGIDHSGLHAAAVITGYMNNTFYVLDEVAVTDTSYEVFLEDHLIPVLNANFGDCEIKAVLDPANSRMSLNKGTALQMTLDAGFDADLASTNILADRLEAVNRLLNKREGFKVDPRAEIMIQGFRGRYHFKNVPNKPGIYSEMPAKDTQHADVMDALGYAALGFNTFANRPKSRPVKFHRPRRAV
jgi:hypothetical protein